MAKPMVWTREAIGKFWRHHATRHPETYFSKQMARGLCTLSKPYLGERHLDYGSGEGSFTAFLRSRGYQSQGWEPDDPLPSGKFNSVTAFEVLEHMNDEALESAMMTIKMFLMDGGYLILTVPNAEMLEKNLVYCPNCETEFHPMQHERSWNKDSLPKYLRRSGFSIVKVKPLTFWKRHSTSLAVRAMYAAKIFLNRERYENLFVIAQKD
jgi:SAM-dependent methyltransferase